MFNWVKKGRLFEADIAGFSHGSHPCAIHLDGDLFLMAFTCRDVDQRSFIFLSHAIVQGGRVVLQGTPKLALEPGAIGHFDCDGAISGCLVRDGEQYFLYYVGWQNLPDGLWICDTGRAIVNTTELTLEREFLGPIFGRDRHHPLFAAATAFFVSEDGQWHTWYNSGILWERRDNGWYHRYGLHHATSTNGLDWVCDPGMCIPFADEYEYAFGRPSVAKWGERFHMWFAHRATKEISTYRIGYASSVDGVSWDRNDAISGIDVAEQGWDSQMICYPCVFDHKGYKYMLYNGNHYGKTGFGLAVLEE